MDLPKINKITTVKDCNLISQHKLNTNTKRTLENQQTLEMRFRDEVKATPRTTTTVKSKSNFGIEEIDRTEVSKDSGFVQLVFDDRSKTNETPLSQHSPILGRKVKRSRESHQQFNVYQAEEEICQNDNNINTREKLLEEGININNENKSQQKVVGNIESFDIDDFVDKLTPRDVLEILKENHSLTVQLRLDRKLNKNRLSLKRKRKESDPSVIYSEESSKVPDKILTDEQIETPLIKRRRELYSAKDTDLTEADICITETEENTRNSNFILRDDVQVNLRTDAKQYKELKRVRKDSPAQNLFQRKSSSRKSFAFNSFDKLNAVVDIDPEIVYVDNTDVYDFTSSAETDKEFEKKKIVTRNVKRVNKSDAYDVSNSAGSDTDFEKKKIVTRTLKHVTRTVKPVNKADVYDVTSSAKADKDFEKKNIVTRIVGRMHKSDVYDVSNSAGADTDFEKKKIVTRTLKHVTRTVRPVNKSNVYDVTRSAEAEKDFEKKKIVTRTVKHVNKSDANDVTRSAEADKDFEKKNIVTRTVHVNKSDVYDVSNTAEADKDFEKKKVVTRTEKKPRRPRSKVSKHTRCSKSKMKTKMVDEWIRKADPFYLNSIIAPGSCDQETGTEINIHNKPRVDMLPECTDSDKKSTPAKKTLKWNQKRCKDRKGKHEDHISDEISLPELEIETIPAFTKPAYLDSDKLKNHNDHLHQSDLTLILPHVSEQVNDNCAPTKVNIASNRSQRTSSDIPHKEVHDVMDELDAKSISTTGASPITAHGVCEESPPKIDDITRTISPRSLEAEGLSEKAREYYHQLLKDIDPSSEQHRRSKLGEKPKKDKILCLSVTRLPLSELRRYSREPHEFKSADPSARTYSNLQGTFTEAETFNSSDGESIACINRKPITKPITQVKENADFKLRNTDSLASKSLTFERVKEKHPSTSRPRQNGSEEHRSVASSIDDCFQRNGSAKSRRADDLYELFDMIIDKIESTLPEVLKNTNTLLVQLAEALVAEFVDRAGDIFRRVEQAAAEGMRQLIQDIQALKPAALDL